MHLSSTRGLLASATEAPSCAGGAHTSPCKGRRYTTTASPCTIQEAASAVSAAAVATAAVVAATPVASEGRAPGGAAPSPSRSVMATGPCSALFRAGNARVSSCLTLLSDAASLRVGLLLLLGCFCSIRAAWSLPLRPTTSAAVAAPCGALQRPFVILTPSSAAMSLSSPAAGAAAVVTRMAGDIPSSGSSAAAVASPAAAFVALPPVVSLSAALPTAAKSPGTAGATASVAAATARPVVTTVLLASEASLSAVPSRNRKGLQDWPQTRSSQAGVSPIALSSSSSTGGSPAPSLSAAASWSAASPLSAVAPLSPASPSSVASPLPAGGYVGADTSVGGLWGQEVPAAAEHSSSLSSCSAAAAAGVGENNIAKRSAFSVSPHVAQMLYEDMLLGRALEDACFRLYYQGKTAGFVHLYTGQEAVSSGVIKLLRQDDAVVSTYRDHVHASSKGVPPHEIMAELFGKSTGCSKGRGGSMHMFSKKYNMIGGFAFIGEQIPIALGYAFSAAYRRFSLTQQTPAAASGAATAAAAAPAEQHDQVTVCFLGDGTTNIGQLWEALNIAALAKLPVVFVVENNNWAIGMAAQRSTAIPRVWQRAETFGVVGVEVDGMDVLAVRSVARCAIERARRGEGPTLIEALTYRFRGHSVADPDEMRAPKQKEAWAVRDPILAFEEQLKLFGYANNDTIRQTREKVNDLMKKAVDFAEKSVESPVQECGSYIFAPGYPGGAEQERLSQEQLHAYAVALKEELDWKGRLKAGDRSPRPPITQAFKPPTIID